METCECQKREYDFSNRDPETNHVLCKNCSRPFRELATFTCSLCGQPSINTYFHEFNLFKDYDSSGNLLTQLGCETCYE